MKTIYIILMFGAAFLALYEQSKPQSEKNMIVMIAAIAIFMVGLMRLMAKVPSKNNREKENEDV
ncbi:hypothetical protein E0W68_12200 [Flavobacterium salilacus subsp. salilacus]|uniref:hypothetical protein n=1 Tax=Flavobacterium TaxID=237 RepID=UPI001074DD92|nr:MULTISPECIES: hypothetical protein [Flavobacterium]KAF2516288.1 hypothetical protein E0W68_12200 [Flavobacterium salilacus subsp. salilacus]MBE1613818.1 hypothetical protein [Flavobacterium sp. SaA2.13]NDI99933.1 hypothetical protein [Flavobacterium salilacus subsp. altitudinum]